MARNPFSQLYVGEKIDPGEFIDIFSHGLVEHAMPLFQSGHVVLSGVQGSGKSMLFKLLQPEVRLAYASEDLDLPIDQESRNFIGAGININHSSCKDFGKRRAEPGSNMHELMFGDFFNYIIVRDMIRSVQSLAENPKTAADLGLLWEPRKVDQFVRSVRGHQVWEGYLASCNSLEDLIARIDLRDALYRRYLNGNDRQINSEVFSTKTSAGKPMKVVAKAFKQCEIVNADTEFFILIDQYEELATIKGESSSTADYRSVVNGVLDRDPTLSYRLGTRGYAWRNHLNIFGSDARLEEDRDYKLIDLDAKLRGTELRKANIFPGFANDVFERRLKHSMRSGMKRARGIKISEALGRSPVPVDQARELSGENPSAVVRLDSEWPSQIQEMLLSLARRDPLSAKLGEAWIRQKGFDGVTQGGDLPWQQKQYWRKERIELALLHIAAIKKQRAVIYGEDDVLALSGGNILQFLSVCQHIWDSATQASSSEEARPQFPIKGSVQTIGVFRAAKAWLDRIPWDYGRSDDRYKLIQLLGERFAQLLYSDPKMSNPGQSGISFSIEELHSNPDIFNFLIEAVDYGNLIMVEHATRNKDRKRRYKFYLNPLYCPIYRIPYQRSKEPLYSTVDKFKEWLADAKIIDRIAAPRNKRADRVSGTAPLLDLLEKEGE